MIFDNIFDNLQLFHCCVGKIGGNCRCGICRGDNCRVVKMGGYCRGGNCRGG